MSQKAHIDHVKIRGHVYLGVQDHPWSDVPGDEWSADPEVVMGWMCDGFRARFNQHRSKRSRCVRTVDGNVLTDRDDKPVMEYLGRWGPDELSDKQARQQCSYLSALPATVLQAAERVESTEWWAAVKRRKTNISKGRPGGAMPGFRSKRSGDARFVCWYDNASNAVFLRTGRRSGVVTVNGKNPSGKYGPSEQLRWAVRIHVKLSEPIRPYTSVRVDWARRELVFVNMPLPVTGRLAERPEVGLDRGAVHPLATSDGELFDLPYPAKLAKTEKERKFHQRRMAKSRKVVGARGEEGAQPKKAGPLRPSKRYLAHKGAKAAHPSPKPPKRAQEPQRHRAPRSPTSSKRYQRHKAEAARLSALQARCLDDWRHKLATNLIRRYDFFAIEDLSLRALTRKAKGKGAKAKRGLNRALLVPGLADMLSKLDYRAKLVLARVVSVNPAYTSQRCSECGYISPDNRESQAVFRCKKCGHTDNADVNAAKNILAIAKAITQSGRGTSWRGSMGKTENPQGPRATSLAAPAMNREPQAAA